MSFTSPNDRIFYAAQAVQVGGSYLEGAQSVGVSRTTAPETLLDVGYAQSSKMRWGRQEYSITISRVIPRGGTLQLESGGTSYTTNHLLKRIGTDGVNGWSLEPEIKIIYAPDDQSYVGQTTEGLVATFTKSLLTNISYSFNVNGAFVEDTTYICRTRDEDSVNPPAGFPESGTTLKRQDIILSDCILPTEVTNRMDIGPTVDGIGVVGLQNISIAVDISYEELFNNGEWSGSTDSGATQNRMKAITLPIGITCTFEGINRQHDTVSNPAVSDAYNTNDEEIRIAIDDGSGNKRQFHLGTKNYLTSIEVTGGDAGGDNSTVSMSYQNDYSDYFTISQAALASFSGTRF